MDRRTFLKTSALSSMAVGIGAGSRAAKTHILSLSFDDGFKKSFYKVADIYENYGLRACMNVIASGHLPGFQAVGKWILPELMGSFDDWNALKARGHEIMPHSWKHLNLTEQLLEEARELIVKCLDYFQEHLEGYNPRYAVFNFPFNASTPELEKFALSKVLAVRTGGGDANNPIPGAQQPFRQACWSHGPDNIDHWVEERVNEFLDSAGGWLILNTHGLDDEGWGPMTAPYLDRLLKRLVEIHHLEILPVGAVLKRSVG